MFFFMSIDKNLAERLETLVNTKEYSIKEFAELIETPTSNMYGYLNGKRAIGLKIINKIKEVIPSLNINWLLYNEGDMFLNEDALVTANEPNATYEKQNTLDNIINGIVESRVNVLEKKLDKKLENLKSELFLGDKDSEMIEKLKRIIEDSTH